MKQKLLIIIISLIPISIFSQKNLEELYNNISQITNDRANTEVELIYLDTNKYVFFSIKQSEKNNIHALLDFQNEIVYVIYFNLKKTEKDKIVIFEKDKNLQDVLSFSNNKLNYIYRTSEDGDIIARLLEQERKSLERLEQIPNLYSPLFREKIFVNGMKRESKRTVKYDTNYTYYYEIFLEKKT